MSEMAFPFVVDTLGKMRQTGARLSVNCNNHGCHKHTMLDMDALIERLGEDHGCMHWDLVRHFHCQDCRAAGRPDRNITFLHHAETGSRHPNAYQRSKGG